MSNSALNERLVHAFLADPTFRDRNILVHGAISQGGLFQISYETMSYYMDALEIRDPRTVRYPTPSFTSTLKPGIIIDNFDFEDTITSYNLAPNTEKASFFNVIERLFFKNTPTDNPNSLNTEFLTDPDHYGVYQADSLTISTDTVTGTAYQDNGVEVPVTSKAWFKFKVRFSLPNDAYDIVEFKIWCNNSNFRAEYPLSHIVEVSQPLDFTTLLYAPLAGLGSNQFDVSMTTSTTIANRFHPKINLDNSSGTYVQKIKFFDNSGNERLVPFSILYKGQKPGLIDVRRRLRDLVLNSGVGTYAEWRRRAPELFIDNQYYLIPQWNIIYDRPDARIYPNITPLRILKNNTVLALTQYASDYIAETLEVITSHYDKLTIASVPHVDNVDNRNILEKHPTYQSYAPTDPNFAFMSEGARYLSIRLAVALSVASGKSVDLNYEARPESGNNYVAFTVEYAGPQTGQVGIDEYLVMTKESFANNIGIPPLP